MLTAHCAFVKGAERVILIDKEEDRLQVRGRRPPPPAGVVDAAGRTGPAGEAVSSQRAADPSVPMTAVAACSCPACPFILAPSLAFAVLQFAREKIPRVETINFNGGWVGGWDGGQGTRGGRREPRERTGAGVPCGALHDSFLRGMRCAQQASTPPRAPRCGPHRLCRKEAVRCPA